MSGPKKIYGFGLSYREMREKAGIVTYRARRIELCDKFANKALGSDRFSRWFPEKQRAKASGRSGDTYQEYQARTDRLYTSPLYYYRRHLNGKEGKKYGERNRKYQDE